MLVLQGHYLYYNGTPLHFWASIFLEFLSLVALFGIKDGVQKFKKTRYIQKNGISVNAIITGYYIETFRINTYYPIIKYKDKNKITHKYQSSVGMTIVLPKYKKGRKVKAVYIPKQPEIFIIIPAYFFEAVLEIFLFSVIAVPSMLGSWTLVYKF